MRLLPALRIALWYRRQEAGQLFAYALLAIAIVTACLVLPHRKGALENTRAQLEALEKEAARIPAMPASQPEPEARLAEFRRMLGARHETERHVETLLAIAGDKKLAVRKAEYRGAFNKPGQYHTYEVTIPFKAEYSSVRAFSDEVLGSFPFASIDVIQFSRTAVDVASIDAKVTLTFYLTDADISAKASEPSRSSATAIPTKAIIR